MFLNIIKMVFLAFDHQIMRRLVLVLAPILQLIIYNFEYLISPPSKLLSSLQAVLPEQFTLVSFPISLKVKNILSIIWDEDLIEAKRRRRKIVSYFRDTPFILPWMSCHLMPCATCGVFISFGVIIFSSMSSTLMQKAKATGSKLKLARNRVSHLHFLEFQKLFP